MCQLLDLPKPPRALPIRRSTITRNACTVRAFSITHGSNGDSVHHILTAVAHGRVDVHDAAASIEEISSGLHSLRPTTAPIAIIDAPGMPAATLARKLGAAAVGQHTAAARNVPCEVYASVRNILPGVQYHAGAQMLLYHDEGAEVPKPVKLPGRVAILCGSGMDLKMAYEAKVTLGVMGGYGTMYQGATAADLPGLIQTRQQIKDVDAVIVCCGEQPSLAGLLAGMVDVPVVAVPGVDRPDPTLALPVPGVCKVAAGDGASAAAAAVRTLRVAAQYIQHRKDRDAVVEVQQEPVNSQGEDYDGALAPMREDGGTVVLNNKLLEKATVAR